jgi:hypothetical protein
MSPQINYAAVLRQAVERNAANDLPAVAVAFELLPGYSPSDDATLLDPAILLYPCVHPVLEAVLETAGATRRGRMSWVVGLGEDYNRSPLIQMVDRLKPGTLLLERSTFTTKGPRELGGTALASQLQTFLAGTAAALPWQRFAPVNAHYPTDGPARFGAVTISGGDRVLWIKAITHGLVLPEDLPNIPLNLRAAGKPFTEPKPVRAVDAIAVLDWLVDQGITLVDNTEDDGLAVIRDRVARSVIATPAAGRPALADTSIGRMVFRTASASKIRLPLEAPEGTSAASRGRLSALDVVALQRALPAGTTVLHRGVADTGAMALAVAVDYPALRPYQREAVGLHLATNIGYAQTSSPGLGKTVITYAAFQARAAVTDRFRALVVCEANVREQWVKEADEWFPEATAVAVESRSDATRLAELLHTAEDPVVIILSYGLLPAVIEEMTRRANQEADEAPATFLQVTPGAMGRTVLVAAPVVTVSSSVSIPTPARPSGIPVKVEKHGQLDLFNQLIELIEEAELAKAEVHTITDLVSPETNDDGAALSFEDVTLGALLLDNHWHDITADEAEVLRGTGTKQATALWALRGNSQVATVLTGTPINKGVDDLGRLISWVRNDKHLFHGVKLSKSFDLTRDEDLPEFLAAMGPLVFRRDTSEISDELPMVVPNVLLLDPSPAEKALSTAARYELKRVYQELLAWLDIAEAASDIGTDELAEAREGLKAARGAWLGGTSLARMASSDPAALLGSTSAGAALLAGQGLIEAATAERGTKRTVVVDLITQRVLAGKKCLIFTEFATVATGLIEDFDASGVRVGWVLGGGGKKRDEMIAAFQAGDLDVLVCTSAGERGLNLQMASVIVHYDLPWTPKSVIQRTGRGMRIKSPNKSLELIFPLMRGTIEERVAALVVTRAVEAMRALDTSRGVDTTKTEMGLALGGLVAGLATIEEAKTEGSAMLQMTAILVADGDLEAA